MNKFYMRR